MFSQTYPYSLPLPCSPFPASDHRSIRGKVTLTAPFHHSYHHTAIYKADKLSAGTSSRR